MRATVYTAFLYEHLSSAYERLWLTRKPGWSGGRPGKEQLLRRPRAASPPVTRPFKCQHAQQPVSCFCVWVSVKECKRKNRSICTRGHLAFWHTISLLGHAYVKVHDASCAHYKYEVSMSNPVTRGGVHTWWWRHDGDSRRTKHDYRRLFGW